MDGEFVLYLLIPIIVGVVMYYVIKQLVLMPGATLAGKFVNLGEPKGKTKDEVIGVVGYPNSVSKIFGGELLQWMATGYHIALLFDEKGVCQGVSHEYSAGAPITRPSPPTTTPIVCTSCGSKNIEGAKFCGGCGKPLQLDSESQ